MFATSAEEFKAFVGALEIAILYFPIALIIMHFGLKVLTRGKPYEY